MLTGDRPTGPLHVGHYFGSLRHRVRLQRLGVETFVLVAGHQVLTDRDVAENLPEHVEGLGLDCLAVGIDPARDGVRSRPGARTQPVAAFCSSAL